MTVQAGVKSSVLALGVLAIVTQACGEAAGPSDQARKALGEEILTLMAGAKDVRIYRIEPLPDPSRPNLAGYPVVKEKEIGGDASAISRLVAALHDEDTYGGRPARCFEPHHAARFRAGDDEVTLLVCFTCGWMYTVDASGRTTRTIEIERKGPLASALEFLLQD